MSVSVKLGENNRLCVRSSPFSWDFAEKIKLFNGRMWNAEDKYWSIPLSIENLQQLCSSGSGKEREKRQVYAAFTNKS